MNYFKNLSEEQSRLNLKSEKVELSIADDVKKLVNDFYSEQDAAAIHYNKLGEAIDAFEARLKDIERFEKRIDKMYQVADKAIKEIGINRSTFGLFDDLDKVKTEAKAEADIMKQDIKKLNSVFF